MKQHQNMERDEVLDLRVCFWKTFRQGAWEILFQNEIFEQRLKNAQEKAIRKLGKKKERKKFQSNKQYVQELRGRNLHNVLKKLIGHGDHGRKIS